MCFPTCTAIGSLLLLFSFILELFLIIGQVSNRQFLNKLSFMQAWNVPKDLSYSFGLWNYCTGDGSRAIQSCAKGKAAYNWAKTPTINALVPNLATSKTVHGIFIALFILLFIAMGLSFIFWILSMPICFTRHKRACGYSMSTLCFINFLITLVSLILSLILILSGVRKLSRADQTWQAHAGNSLWILIGACVANFLAFFAFSSGATCVRRKKRDLVYENEQGTVVKKERTNFFGRKKNKTHVEPKYEEAYTAPATNYNSLLPTSAQPVNNYNDQPSMLQQPYTTNTNYNTANNTYEQTQNTGYQTPVLQPANQL